MTTVTFSYKDSLVNELELNRAIDSLQTVRAHMTNALKQKYTTEYASLALPDDDASFEHVCTVIARKKALNPTILVVIGIGGSNLGTMAVHQACMGSILNSFSGITVYYVDTVDPDTTYTVLQHVEMALQVHQNVIVNVISKSGTTTETIANFELFIATLAKYDAADHNSVVVTTDKDSLLWNIAQEKKFECLEISKKVGGRYCVMSAASLFPLGMMGIDIKGLLEGALHARNAVLYNDDISPLMSAAHIWQHYQRNFIIHDTFLFSPDFENIGKWYRQLLAESIGKKTTVNGKEIAVGVVPTVSIGSTDLHSMAQLYLAGPRTVFTTFVAVQSYKTELKVPNLAAYAHVVEHIQGLEFAKIMQAILQGIQVAYRNDERPFVTWHIPEKNSYCIGQFLQYKMIEVMCLGYLFGVNPFDQPQVELYKQETRKLLAYE